MATTCSVQRLSLSGMAQPTTKTTGINASGRLLAIVTLPATSVSDGMTCDVSTYLASHCYGGNVMGRGGSTVAGFVFEVLPSATYTSSQVKIRVTKMTSGVLLSAANDLSDETLYVEFLGY